MKRIIIGIHGLGNKPPRTLLHQWWTDAVSEGLDRIGTRLEIPLELVYWADILHEQPQNPDIQDKDNPLYLSERYQPAKKAEAPQTSAIKARMMRYLERKLDQVFLNDDLSLNFSKVANSIIRRYFKDLEAYYHQTRTIEGSPCPVSNLIRDRLAGILKGYGDCQILLIAHSMGSIIAYDVLWQLARQMEVHTFVSMGSPLGLPAIQHRVHRERNLADVRLGKLISPPNIRSRWYNLSDVEDHVALDQSLADDYQPNRNGLQAQDMEVCNDYIQNGHRNPHKIYGYLRTPELARIIASFQGYQDAGWLRHKTARWTNWMGRLFHRPAQSASQPNGSS